VEYRAHGPHEDALAARAFICSGNVGTAAQCIGVMRGVYELVRDWCDTRVVGGKVLKEHTITAGVLADIVVSIETSRAETYLKARMLDQPEVYGSRDNPEMLARTRVTKPYVSDQLTSVVNKAMDLMGGRALPQLDIARWFFDAQTY
jgi:alkylation response protein AidB-like acyl-CoA dehydrogenase